MHNHISKLKQVHFDSTIIFNLLYEINFSLASIIHQFLYLHQISLNLISII